MVERGPTIRVATYNLRGFRDDVAAAARVVKAIAPDVLCLQEIPHHPLSSHRISTFAERCGLLWSGGHQRAGGTTILTSLRLDLEASHHEPLRVARFKQRRGYAATRVALPRHRAVEVVSTHLSLDAGERVRHAGIVLEAEGRQGPLVLAGDLNEGPDGLAWQAISARLPVVSPDGPTFPAARPQHRIDAVFASPELKAVPHRAVALAETELRAATDHLPVWADLDLSALRLP